MKYFTPELCLGHNSSDEKELQKALDLSEKNYLAYTEQLRELEPLLNKRNFAFFAKESLHDGRLLEFCAGDAVDDAGQGRPFNINRHDTRVRMTVAGCYLDVLYTLNYRKLRQVSFAYPGTALFHYSGDHIGDWGYDELTRSDSEYFQHEILFASGTTILIQFKQFSFRKVKVRGSRYASVLFPSL